MIFIVSPGPLDSNSYASQINLNILDGHVTIYQLYRYGPGVDTVYGDETFSISLFSQNGKTTNYSIIQIWFHCFDLIPKVISYSNNSNYCNTYLWLSKVFKEFITSKCLDIKNKECSSLRPLIQFQMRPLQFLLKLPTPLPNLGVVLLESAQF